MSSQQKLVLYLLACVQFTSIMDFMIMMPMGPLLIRSFETTAGGFNFLVSAYSLAAGLTGFVAAFFVDNYDRKKILTLAYIGFLVGTFFCAIAPNYDMMMAARIVAGVFGGVLGSQVVAIVGDTVAYKNRAEAMAIIMSAFSVASVLGVPMGMWLATTFGWHVPFGFVVAVGMINLVLIYKYLPNLTTHINNLKNKPNPLSVLTNIAKDNNQLRAVALSAIVIFGHFITIPSLSPYLTQNVGMAEDKLSLIYLIGGGITIFSSRIFGKLADKKGKYKIFAITAILFLSPVLIMPYLPYGAAIWQILAVTTLFFLFANGRTITMQALVSGVVNNTNRGGFTSINQSVIQLASGLSSFVAGLIVIKGQNGKLEHYQQLGYVTIITMLVGVWLASTIKPVKAE